MSTNLYRITAAETISRMRPTTLVDFIASLDFDGATLDRTGASLLTAATEALIGIVGTSEAIEMLSEADVNASNPIIERIFQEQLSELQNL